MLKKSPQTPTLFPSISGKKIKTENNISNYLWTVLIIEDNQQSEVVEEITSVKNPAIQEDDSPDRYILELPFLYSPEQQQAFKDRLWDFGTEALGRFFYYSFIEKLVLRKNILGIHKTFYFI